MTTSCTKNADSTVSVVVTVEGDVWTKAQKKAFNKRKQTLNLKGFRKGQVPDAIAKKYIPQDAVYYFAVDEVAPNALEEAVKEHDLQIIGRPSMDFENASDKSVTIKFEVPVMPEVTLGEYKNLGVKKEEVNVTDEQVEEAVKDLRHREAVLEEAEEGTAAKEGDEVTLDFSGTIDGEPFEGGTAQDQELVLGSKAFIPGFEDQLIGVKVGDVKDVKVTFPENYPASTLAGKEAVFTVTVKGLKVEDLPELTDEFVAGLGIEGVSTVEELKKHERERLVTRTTREAEQKWIDELLEKVVENAQVDVPAVMVNNELNNIMNDFAQNLSRNGIQFNDYLQLLGGDRSVIEEQFRPQAVQRARTFLVLNAIGKAEKIKVSAEELNKELEAIATMYGTDVDNLRKMINMSSVENDMTQNKIVQFLKSVNE